MNNLKRLTISVAMLTVVCNIIFIVFRINHWEISRYVVESGYTMLVIMSSIAIYLTWFGRNSLQNSEKIMWTIALVLIALIAMPIWYLKISNSQKVKTI